MLPAVVGLCMVCWVESRLWLFLPRILSVITVWYSYIKLTPALLEMVPWCQRKKLWYLNPASKRYASSVRCVIWIRSTVDSRRWIATQLTVRLYNFDWILINDLWYFNAIMSLLLELCFYWPHSLLADFYSSLGFPRSCFVDYLLCTWTVLTGDKRSAVSIQCHFVLFQTKLAC